MQRQLPGLGDLVVGHPLLAGAVRARNHDPVQHGGEHSTLDRKLELAAGEKFANDRAAAGLMPQAPEQQGWADALGQQARAIKVGLQRRQQHDLLAEPRAGGEQGGECAAHGQLVGPSDGGDHVLPHRAVLALVLDDLQIAARSGLLEAEEHGALRTEHHDVSCLLRFARLMCPRRGTTFLSESPVQRQNVQSNQCSRLALPVVTVQVEPFWSAHR
jgi:hypothetical protein